MIAPGCLIKRDALGRICSIEQLPLRFIPADALPSPVHNPRGGLADRDHSGAGVCVGSFHDGDNARA